MSRANGRRDVDTLLAAALCSGATLKDAAAQVGISLSTAKRRAADPEFVALVDQARADIVKSLHTRTLQAGGQALSTLVQLLESESETVQLGAARALLGAAAPRDQNSVARFTSKDVTEIAALFYETLAKFIPDNHRGRAASALDGALAAKTAG